MSGPNTNAVPPSRSAAIDRQLRNALDGPIAAACHEAYPYDGLITLLGVDYYADYVRCRVQEPLFVGIDAHRALVRVRFDQRRDWRGGVDYRAAVARCDELGTQAFAQCRVYLERGRVGAVAVQRAGLGGGCLENASRPTEAPGTGEDVLIDVGGEVPPDVIVADGAVPVAGVADAGSGDDGDETETDADAVDGDAPMDAGVPGPIEPPPIAGEDSGIIPPQYQLTWYTHALENEGLQDWADDSGEVDNIPNDPQAAHRLGTWTVVTRAGTPDATSLFDATAALFLDPTQAPFGLDFQGDDLHPEALQGGLLLFSPYPSDPADPLYDPEYDPALTGAIVYVAFADQLSLEQGLLAGASPLAELVAATDSGIVRVATYQAVSGQSAAIDAVGGYKEIYYTPADGLEWPPKPADPQL